LKSSAPLISFTPCALSNTLSSWGQYQALSYVSFSLQTIFKSTKVIPVMFLGTILKGTTYSCEAILITLGVLIFSLAKGSMSTSDRQSNILGFSLLCLYILSDSFTSQWQSRLYRDYGKISHYQMMYGVNVSSIILTITAMLFSGEIPFVIIPALSIIASSPLSQAPQDKSQYSILSNDLDRLYSLSS
jgi:solute carrier family 35 (adenosine 3'-phospho 5'-phosphosulfate transporter), member B2